MTFAVIPAAGKSTRMGRPKLSLPVGARTVLEHVIGTLQSAGIEHILVVVAPHVSELVPLAESAGAQVYLLPEETPDMRATVEAGLRWIEERFHPKNDDAWLLVPADHPTLAADVVRQLLAARAANQPKTIVVPVYEGKRGHPTVIAWKHAHELRAFGVGQGLNAYLRQFSDETLELSVTDADVLCDLDTPLDYAKVHSRRQGRR